MVRLARGVAVFSFASWVVAVAPPVAVAAEEGAAPEPTAPAAPEPRIDNAELEAEEAALAASAQATTEEPATPPPTAAAPSAAAPSPRRRVRLSAEPVEPRAATSAAAGEGAGAHAGSAAGGLALELGTSAFASGTLAGGIFIGARLDPSLIIGGAIDLAHSSTETKEGALRATDSRSAYRLGFGARYSLLRSGDGHVELFGTGDLGLVYASLARDVTSTIEGVATYNETAWGVFLGAGPGLRYWVHESFAIGYSTRLTWTWMTGGGRVVAPAGFDQNLFGSKSEASATTLGLEGTFQLLAVF